MVAGHTACLSRIDRGQETADEDEDFGAMEAEKNMHLLLQECKCGTKNRVTERWNNGSFERKGYSLCLHCSILYVTCMVEEICERENEL